MNNIFSRSNTDTISNIYSPRKRSENQAVIQALLNSRGEEEYKKSIKLIGDNYHPSLFPELDFLESHSEENMKDNLIKINNYVYVDNLDKILLYRKAEIPEDEYDLSLEVFENVEFYENLMKTPNLIDILDDTTVARIQKSITDCKDQTSWSDYYQSYYDYEKSGKNLYEQLRLHKDNRVILQIISAALINCLFYYLDKLSSRLKTRRFITDEHIDWPLKTPHTRLENQEQREDFIYYLEDLQSKARRWRLFLLDKLCEYCLTFISRFPVHKYKDFEGHYMEGLGPCGRCSMFFPSSALSIISPVSQSVVDFQYNWIYFPPDFITTAIEKQHDATNNIDTLEPELQMVEKQLRALDREQKQLLQWALKGFPEDTVVAENKRINENRSNLQSRKAALETQMQASREAVVSLPKLEEYIQLVREKLTNLDFDMKRLALDMLNIKIWVDGSSVEITGTIPVEDSEVVTASS